MSRAAFTFPLGKTGGLIEATSTRITTSGTRTCFRWVKPAASLKHGRAKLDRAVEVRMFPLGKTGGLIEANRINLHNKGGAGLFPLGKTGGLIEARCCVRHWPWRGRFPLGKTGGLIEASCSRSGGTARPPGFRWVKPAASLKLEFAQYRRLVHGGVSAG